MAELNSFPNQQPQDSDEVAAAHDSNGDGTLDDTVNWTWSGMKDALDSAGFARLGENETVTGYWSFDSRVNFSALTNDRAMILGGGGSFRTLYNANSPAVRINTDFNDTSNSIFRLTAGSAETIYATIAQGSTNSHIPADLGVGTNSPNCALDTNGTIRAQDRLLTDFSDPTVFSAREVKSGTSAPSDSEGKNGDIYIQTN